MPIPGQSAVVEFHKSNLFEQARADQYVYENTSQLRSYKPELSPEEAETRAESMLTHKLYTETAYSDKFGLKIARMAQRWDRYRTAVMWDEGTADYHEEKALTGALIDEGSSFTYSLFAHLEAQRQSIPVAAPEIQGALEYERGILLGAMLNVFDARLQHSGDAHPQEPGTDTVSFPVEYAHGAGQWKISRIQQTNEVVYELDTNEGAGNDNQVDTLQIVESVPEIYLPSDRVPGMPQFLSGKLLVITHTVAPVAQQFQIHRPRLVPAHFQTA